MSAQVRIAATLPGFDNQVWLYKINERWPIITMPGWQPIEHNGVSYSLTGSKAEALMMPYETAIALLLIFDGVFEQRVLSIDDPRTVRGDP